MRRIIFLACLLLAACKDNYMIPPPATSVTLSLQATSARGTPDSPVILTTLLSNHSRDSLVRIISCADLPNGGTIRVFDSNSRVVYYENPNRGECNIVRLAGFAPGQSVSDTVRFNGVLYDTSGNMYVAPSGIYTVSAFYGYSIPHSETAGSVVQRVSFEWIGQ